MAMGISHGMATVDSSVGGGRAILLRDCPVRATLQKRGLSSIANQEYCFHA